MILKNITKSILMILFYIKILSKLRMIKINKETLHLNKVKDLISTENEEKLIELVDFVKCTLLLEIVF